ncbi:hypothetical protein AAES_79324 [Amazona aestiva]|uniref:Uncharacterized protein n=1 Tax=Amazona aestiva TaxID=12930 RepID=A0A0Q3Q0A5_AMAAE|nr:hypothetical protein AAES_79324 [Amazona aestiva]
MQPHLVCQECALHSGSRGNTDEGQSEVEISRLRFVLKMGTRWCKKLISCVTGNTDGNEMVQEADKLRGRSHSSSTLKMKNNIKRPKKEDDIGEDTIVDKSRKITSIDSWDR